MLTCACLQSTTKLQYTTEHIIRQTFY